MDTLDIAVGSYLLGAIGYEVVKVSHILNSLEQNTAYGVLKRDQKTKQLYMKSEDVIFCALPFPLDVAYLTVMDSKHIEFFKF